MALEYKIYRDGVFLKKVSGLTATITDLTPNTKYTFEVTETDGVDESAKSNKIEITTNSIPVSSITLDRATLSISKGASFELTATILPSNATDKKVTWSSSIVGNVSILPNALKCKVTGILSGSSVITAKTDNGKSATCTVTVTPVVKVPINLKSTSVTENSVTLAWEKGV